MAVEKVCNYCGKKFSIYLADDKRGHGKYCSLSCFGKSITKSTVFIEKECKICGKKFSITQYREQRGRGKYCSMFCRNVGYANGLNNRYGKKHTEKTKKKMSKIMSKIMANKFTKESLKQWSLRSNLIQQNKKEPTSIEKTVYEFLNQKNIPYNKQELINNRFLVDVHVPLLNLIVEVDGNYWHSLPRTVKKDKAENAYLVKCGFNLIRLPEKEVKDNSFIKRMEVFL